MTEHDLQLLSQYLDDELSPAQVGALEQRLATEPALRREWQRFKLADEQVRALANVPGADQIPAQVSAMLQLDYQRQKKGGAKILTFPTRRPLHTGAGFAVAASLVMAIGLILTPQWRSTNHSVHPAAASQPGIAQALEGTPSSLDEWVAVGANSHLRPVLSFANTQGQWCREYQIQQDTSQWRGIACRTNSGWHTELVVTDGSLAVTGTEYQPAGADDADAIANYVNTQSSDIPLSADDEVRLIGNSWQ